MTTLGRSSDIGDQFFTSKQRKSVSIRPEIQMMNDQFLLDESLIYLNHAAVSPWPLVTVHAVEKFARENLQFGAAHYPDWVKSENELRRILCLLINAPSSDDISLLKNTSEALSTIAYGIDWKSGDNVVTFRQEFPSNRIVWESLRQFGVETRLVDLSATTDADNPEEKLMACCDENTRLLSTSSVQYATGFRVDLETIGRFCRQRDILFCVDAIQSLGAIPFDVQRNKADFVVADGHKWMLGPEGLALLFVRPELRAKLKLHQFGWHMISRPGDFDQVDWKPSDTATRFECGSPNMLGIHALKASLTLIQEQGIETIFEKILTNTAFLIDLVESSGDGLSLLSNRNNSRRSGIVSFAVAGMDPMLLHQRLMRSGVICASRGGGIRLSPHFYTSRAKLEAAWDRVMEQVN